MREYQKLNEEALDRTYCRRDYGPVLRQVTKLMIDEGNLSLGRF